MKVPWKKSLYQEASVYLSYVQRVKYSAELTDNKIATWQINWHVDINSLCNNQKSFMVAQQLTQAIVRCC